MTKYFKILSVFIVVIGLLHIYACEYYDEDIEDGSYTTFNIIEELSDISDPQGNLEIQNNTDYRYLLYVNDSLSRLVPAHAAKHLIYIQATGGQAFNLKLYKKTDLSDNEILNPPVSKIDLQWDVILPRETWDNVRVKWVVDDFAHNEDALVGFLYSGQDASGGANPFSVDIFLNSKNGIKILSLAPEGYSSANLSFGYQVLLFRYWKSNPSSPNGQDEKGWVEQKPNGTSYGLVLNSYNDSLTFQVPVFFEVYPEINGYLKFDNQTDNDFYIRANGLKFEDFIILPEGNSTSGMSYIENQSTTPDFKVPIGEYLLRAIVPSSGLEYETTVLYVNQNDSLLWTIH